VVSMLDASLVPLPLPGSTDILVLLLAARHTAPWLLVVASVGGSVLGGSLTWSAGKKGGEAMLEKHVPKRFLARLERWVKHHGPASVATAAILPPPIPLMPFLLAAGALGVARKQFLWAFTAARMLRYGAIVWLGATYGRRVGKLWSSYVAGWSHVILWSFLGLLAAAVLLGVWKYRQDQHKQKLASAVTSCSSPARDAGP